MGTKEDDAYDLMMEEKEEPMRIWIDDNIETLQEDYLEDRVSPEDQPLDDDYCDFFDKYYDEFDEYCKDRYREDN